MCTPSWIWVVTKNLLNSTSSALHVVKWALKERVSYWRWQLFPDVECTNGRRAMWPNLRSEDRRALGSVFPPFNKAVRQTSVGELDPAANGRSFVERKRRICIATFYCKVNSYNSIDFSLPWISFYSICPLLFCSFLFLFLFSLSLFLSSYVCIFHFFLVFFSSLFLPSTVSFVFNLISFFLFFISHLFIL